MEKGTREMNANEHLDFYNPDSIYYGNSRHYIQQLENKVRQQQAEIEELKAKVQLHEAMDSQCASLMQQFRKASDI